MGRVSAGDLWGWLYTVHMHLAVPPKHVRIVLISFINFTTIKINQPKTENIEEW